MPSLPTGCCADDEQVIALTRDFRLVQKRRGHRYSVDDMLVAHLACTRGVEPRRVLDLGCGLGSVLLVTAWAFREAELVGLEILPEHAAFARRSVLLDGCEGRARIVEGDLRDTALVESLGRFDLVTGSPPYFVPGSGTPCADGARAAAHFEINGGIEDYAAAASIALAPGGAFVACAGAEPPARAREALAKAGLSIAYLRTVVPRAGRKPFLILIVGIKDGRPAVEGAAGSVGEAPPLVLRDEDGGLSPQHDAIREWTGIKRGADPLSSNQSVPVVTSDAHYAGRKMAGERMTDERAEDGDRTAKLEAEVMESARRYRAIFETTGTGTFIIDDRLTILLVNEEFERLTGYTREEMEGKMRGTDFILPEYLPKIKHYHELRSKDPRLVPRSYEIRVRHRDGTIHDGMITISMIPGSSQRVISFMDITDRKRAEQEMYRAEKMAALGQLIAGVAHEISNPNSFIHTNLPTLERYMEAMDGVLEEGSRKDPDRKLLGMTVEEFRKDLKALVADMKVGSARISEIAKDLRTHVTSDKQDAWESASIDTVLAHVKSLVGKQVGKTVKRVEWVVPPDLPQVALVPGRIEQTIINLVINASHAVDKKDSWIRVEAALASDGQSVEISVSDNGCGIPEDVRGKIFEPFFTTKPREVGTGLGLWICREIVRDHGGSIVVESTPGTGSTFRVALPLHGRRWFL